MASNRQGDRVATYKMFVKNLPDGVSNEELKLIFEEFGRVVECEIFQRDLSLAFVYMEDDICGKNAISFLNGRSIGGRPVTVTEAKLADQGPNIPTTRLRVKNIPDSLTARNLRSLFVKYGIVVSAEITHEEGIVNLEALGDVRAAINEINGFIYDGCELTVEPMINTSESYTLIMSQLKLPPLPPPPPPPSLLPTPRQPQPLLKTPIVQPLFDPLPQCRNTPYLDGARSNYNDMHDVHNKFNSDYGYGENGTSASQQNAYDYDEGDNDNADGNGDNEESGYWEDSLDTNEYKPEPEIHRIPIYPGIRPAATRFPNSIDEPFNSHGPEWDQKQRNPFQMQDGFSRGFGNGYLASSGPRFQAPPNFNSSGDEGRVLRDPYGPVDNPRPRGTFPPPYKQPFNSPSQTRPWFRQPNSSCQSMQSFTSPARPFTPKVGTASSQIRQFTPKFVSDSPRMRQSTANFVANTQRSNQNSATDIEPLFLQRHSHLEGVPRTSFLSTPTPAVSKSKAADFFEDNFDNDGNFQLNQPSTPTPTQRPPSLLSEFLRTGGSESAYLAHSSNAPAKPVPLMGGFQSSKQKVPRVAPGQPYEVPKMIQPGQFQPPRKYFANRPRPKGKRKYTEPRPEPPIPETYEKPVPLFPPTYGANAIPCGAKLTPFPPPPLPNQYAKKDYV